MADTIFDRIIRKEIPADVVFEDEHVLAFKDISPQAPVHILVIPKVRIAKLAEAEQEHQALLGQLLLAVKTIASSLELKDYRIVINNGEQAGQTVFHLHLHLLAGRPMEWPPG